MLQHLVNPNPLLRVLLQNPIDKCLPHRTNLTGVLVVHITDALHRLLTTDVVEGRSAADQFEGQHTNAPYIHAIVVPLPLDDLGRDVVQSAAVGRPPVLADRRPSEIAQLADILNQNGSTLVMTMFSGLISRCRMELSCISFNPKQTSFNFSTA
jgi:hypothetical protein